MRRYWRLVALLVALCAFVRADGQSLPTTGDSGIAVLRVDNTVSVIATPYVQILEDPRGELDTQSIRSARQGWRSVSGDALVFGISKSVWWVRLQLESTTTRNLNMVLDLGNPKQDYVQWFVLRQAGEFVEEGTTGDRLPYSHRPLPTRNFVLPVHFAPREKVELLIRLRSYDGIFESMPLRIETRDAFFRAAGTEGHLLALFHGGVLALALYNLLLFIATRERAFGWYVLYLFWFVAWSFTSRGLSFQYFWPNAPAFNNDFLRVSAAFTFAAMGCFTATYLRLRASAPAWLFRLVFALIGANVLVSIPGFLGFYAIGAGLGVVAGLLMIVTTLAASAWLLFKGSRQARFYVSAFAIVGIGAFSYVLQVISAVPTNWFTNWGVQIGSAIEVLLLAFGLADAMNTLKAEKIDAERHAREAQEALNAQLAQQVSERNEALELANRRLHDLAITDELTGAFTRRHFSAFCGAALTHRDRNEALAFCIFDIDLFKNYNDRYGHEMGNAALRLVAGAVRNRLRRSADVLFRLGGEEFGILFTAKSAAMAKQFTDQLRESISDLRIAFEETPSGVLTASFGVAWWDVGMTEHLTPNLMYAVADNMVYEAKNAGRNRVAIEAHNPTDAPIPQAAGG